MKKKLFLASVLLASVSAFAATDGSTYETKNGFTCTNIWTHDLQNTGTFNSDNFPFMANPDRLRTAAIDVNDNKVYIGYSKPMDHGDGYTVNTAHVIVFDLVNGGYEKELMLTLNGQPITGLLCANQIGVDDFGHVWFAGYVQTTSTTPVKIYTIDDMETGACTLQAALTLPAEEAATAEGRMDYCHIVGDVTGQEADAVAMWALSDPGTANVHRWVRAKGKTQNPVSNGYSGDWTGGFDGYVSFEQPLETYPADKTWGTAPILTMTADAEYSGSQFYIDGFHSYPALYDTSGAKLDDFSFDAAGVFTPKPNCNGVCEFVLGETPFMAYALSQPNDNGAVGAQIRVVQLGDGFAFSGMQQMWDLPEKSHGQLGDGIRIHSITAKKVVDENGKEGVYLLSYKCKNGIGLYLIAEDGFVAPNGTVTDPDTPVVPEPTNDALTIADQTVLVGQDAVLPIEMKNEGEVCAIQFDLYLPDGVDVTKNDRDKYIFELTDRASDHSISSNLQADGAIRVMIVSFTNDIFSGNSGTVVNVPLTISADAVAGEYSVKIANINMTSPAAVATKPADVTAKFTIMDYIMGDSNGDGEVALTDVVNMINYVIGLAPDKFVKEAADVTGDGTVDITDVVKVINIILNVDTANTASTVSTKTVAKETETAISEEGYAMTINDFNIKAGETKTLYVNMDNVKEIVAFQFDITLPEGLSFAMNSRGKVITALTDRAYDHTISSNIQENGSLRVLAVSMNNEYFSGNTGNVIGIDIVAAENFSGDYTISLTDIKLSEANATGHNIDRYDYTVAKGGDYAMTINDFNIKAGETKTLYVNMDNVKEIVAFQFDITLPEGLSFAMNSRGKVITALTDRAYDHTISSNIQENGSLRVLAVSMNNEYFSGNTGNVIGIDIVASENFSGDYTISLTDIKLSEADATGHNIDRYDYTVNAEMSGISDIVTPCVSVTTDGSDVVVNGVAVGTEIGIYDISGRLVYIGAEHSISVAPNSFYVVKVNGKTYKVVI